MRFQEIETLLAFLQEIGPSKIFFAKKTLFSCQKKELTVVQICSNQVKLEN